MRRAEILEHDRRARAWFTYAADPAGRDTWRSHADQVLAGDAWSGDCDDLASTVLDLLGRAGLPLEQRFRLLVDSSGAGQVDHMIAAALDDAGELLVVGDTFGPAYPAASCRHQVKAYQRLDEWSGGAAVWRDGAPWSAS